MAIPEGPYADLTPEMLFIHTMLRREFGLLPALVRGVAPGDRERGSVVADHIDLLAAVLHSHHHSEDVYLWPKVRDRVPEEAVQVVQQMEDQHEAIEKGNAAVTAATAAWRDDPGTGNRDALAEALDHLVPLVGEHMTAEEERLLPAIEGRVTVAEWAEMAAHAGDGIAPEKGPLVFGMAFYEGDPPVIEATLSRMPAEARAVIEQLAPKVFAEHSELIHGTATPPRVTG